MCGIYACINGVRGNFESGRARGPDHSKLVTVDNVTLGFHRLSINDRSEAGNQPFVLNGVYLACNGEIYNHKDLIFTHQLPVQSNSDCEVILHLYIRYGMKLLDMIDVSEFAFVLYDSNQKVLYAARDALGVRPLYKAVYGDQVVYASELKMCYEGKATYSWVKPGTLETCAVTQGPYAEIAQYATFPYVRDAAVNLGGLIYSTLYDAVMKRVKNTDRPIACLLSGGLDSSIITALVVQCRRDLGYSTPVETYCIGLEGGEDMHHAAVVARHLNTKHTTVVCGEDDFFDAIPEVIRTIESYDTTTVRASVGQYLVAKYISQHSEAKVLFNGDGSDELTGGYLYMKHAPDKYSFESECRRLLTDIHCFDALRSDRCISAHGLEARTPFLDWNVVQLYLSLPTEYKHTNIEKYLLRDTFQHILPASIAWRKKEAFSDGVSSMKESWYQIIQRKVPTADPMNTDLNPPTTAEQHYYRQIFDRHYYYAANTIPYFWMPRFIEAKDCSARTLSVY